MIIYLIVPIFTVPCYCSDKKIFTEDCSARIEGEFPGGLPKSHSYYFS